MIVPGSDGEPLPAGTLVFRIGKNSDLDQEAIKQRKASEILFKPTSRDENSPGQRLSIWVEELTIADQGWAIMGSDPARTIVACLDVDGILAIEPPAPFHSLRVEWEKARLDDGSSNTHSGAEGHAGIAGLCQGSKKGRADKDRRKALRSRLADKATISPVPVPHDILEDQLRVAAYYIHEKEAGTPTANWVSAIRKLRRARVQVHRQQEEQPVGGADAQELEAQLRAASARVGEILRNLL